MGQQPDQPHLAWEETPSDPPGGSSNRGPLPSSMPSGPAAHHSQESRQISRPRRFMVQPVETSSRSSCTQQAGAATDHGGNASDGAQPDNTYARRRFLPEPMETTTTRNYEIRTQKPSSSGPRRFKPEIIETDRRSVQGRPAERSRWNDQMIPAHHGSSWNFQWNSQVPESKFSYASLLRRQEERRHSFRTPNLPSIASNSSEESGEPSKSPSVSPTKPPRPIAGPKAENENVFRESCDDEFSEYLLSLAARSAQKQLKEQALAAFPNEQVYEPVDHFAIDAEERESDGWGKYPTRPPIISRRQSSADLFWELEYMRQHKEEAEQRLRAMAASGKPEGTSTARSCCTSPPMLGDDIVLPWSSSPGGTFCEPPNAERGSQAAPNHRGLWGAGTRREGGRGAGLWMGTCRKDEGREQDLHAASGAITPMDLDSEDEMRSDSQSNVPWNPQPRPDYSKISAPGNVDFSTVLEEEFHDGFVTQIYNYLSLGYPCVARCYDDELSRISAFTVEDLRRDDMHTDAKGYVVAPENELAVACTRWKALRVYIHEWARQQPNMLEDDTGLEAWGVPERRGSWAG